jgi:protein gp37
MNRTITKPKRSSTALAVTGKNANTTLADLRKRLKAEHTAVATAIKTSVAHAMAAGDILIEAKARLGHGKWLSWLEPSEVSERMAQRYMRLARGRAVIAANPTPVSDLDMRGALALIASEPEHTPRHLKPADPNDEITIAQWKAMSVAQQRECLKRENWPSDVEFNKQTGDGIEWAQWSWNPIVGCEHSCRVYCWAHDITLRFADRYPHGFKPVLRPRMLNAPYNTSVPAEAAFDGRFGNVFAIDMADGFGGWVPRAWIEAILQAVTDNPQWRFLFLTKFPNRFVDLAIPANAWMGTSVDLQARVANAEKAFAKLREQNPDAILWLSVEPMLEPITFTRLELFDWCVIGGAAVSSRTPAFKPPGRWIHNLRVACDAADVKVYEKTNLLGNRILELPSNVPIKNPLPQEAPAVFHYLGGKAALKLEQSHDTQQTSNKQTASVE